VDCGLFARSVHTRARLSPLGPAAERDRRPPVRALRECSALPLLLDRLDECPPPSLRHGGGGTPVAPVDAALHTGCDLLPLPLTDQHPSNST
jgi:hypothetical protein